MGISVFWFRRDLRLVDNTALNHALSSGQEVLAIFILDNHILNDLPKDDSRLTFIHQQLFSIDQELKAHQSSLLCLKGDVLEEWKKLIHQFSISKVYFNKDYEPYARKRDKEVGKMLNQHGITMHSFKDQVVFEEYDILKKDGLPYTIFTPYKNKWLENYAAIEPITLPKSPRFYPQQYSFPSIESLGFTVSSIKVLNYNLSNIDTYGITRDIPHLNGTSRLGPHLRFGTISIRSILAEAIHRDATFVSELIWREFFMQILFHFPQVVTQNFKEKYDGIQWLNKAEDFEKWCSGLTGYPMVDAGMRQLNETGYMHNRVRMITAGFLCKHLLIDWRLGEAYFAKKLLDYELSSNNGNWQWAAGTGCDAAPYFRIFNPTTQFKKFDPQFQYVKKWIPELDSLTYPSPMVDHTWARKRALDTYKQGLNR